MCSITGLLDHAAAQGIRVTWDTPRRGAIGAYDVRHHRIAVAPGMTAAMTRSVLAHELAHAERRDSPAGLPPHQVAAMERRADEAAARRLITPGEYAAAEAILSPGTGFSRLFPRERRPP